MRFNLILATAIAFTLALPAVAQNDQPPQPAATQAQSDGWDEIDVRVVFLTTQLASVESSMQAIDRALRMAGYKMAARQGDAERYHQGNVNMDRNGGGPVPWDQFYGNTAKRFYYRGGQLERPPQFDYIYRANAQDQKRAEKDATALGSKIDDLLSRRRQLESDQSALWAKIALRIISSRRADTKALYQFTLTEKGGDAERLETTNAACDFVRAITALVQKAEDTVEPDQGKTYRQIFDTTKASCAELNARLLHQAHLALDLDNSKTSIGALASAVHRLEDVSKNIDDAWRAAEESETAGNPLRVDTSRAMLQDMLVNYAETFVKIDESVRALAKEWAIAPDPVHPFVVESPPSIPPQNISQTTVNPSAAPPPVIPGPMPTGLTTPGQSSPQTLKIDPPLQAKPGEAVDLLTEFDAGHWTKVVKRGSWKKTAEGFRIIPGPGSGPDFGWSYPLSGHPESFVLDMKFRLSPQGAIQVSLSDQPRLIEGIGVALSYKWYKGLNVGDFHDRGTDRVKTIPFGSLEDGWHTLRVAADKGSITATLDDGKPVRWEGQVPLNSITLSGDEFIDWYIDRLTLRTEPPAHPIANPPTTTKPATVVLPESTTDLLSEFDVGRWTKVVKRGSWERNAKGFHVIGERGPGPDFGWSYPLNDGTDSIALEMRFRSAEREPHEMQVNFSDQPAHTEGIGVAIDYRWLKGFSVGNLGRGMVKSCA